MCVVSAVYDHWERLIPPVAIPAPAPMSNGGTIQITGAMGATELAELRKLIADFREALAAARTVDRLTGQSDCEDPDKAKLEARVTVLEKEIARLSRKPMRKAKR